MNKLPWDVLMTLEIVFAFDNEFPGVLTEQRRILRDERFSRLNVSSDRRDPSHRVKHFSNSRTECTDPQYFSSMRSITVKLSDAFPSKHQ
jgi:hypothetical protein